MDPQRGRSPSMGHQQPHINQTHSPSPHPFQDSNHSIGLGLALETPTPDNRNNNNNNNNLQYSNDGFAQTHNISFDNQNFLSQQAAQSFSQGGTGESTYVHSQDFTPQFKQEEQSPFHPQQGSFTQELLDPNLSSSFNEGDFSLYPGNQADQYDPSFFMNELPSQSSNQSVDPSQLDMSSPPNHTSTPPNLLQPDHPPSSVHGSPSFNQGQFQPSPNHSRNASLGPESAAYPNQVDWSMMPPQFTTHRRTPSEYSDVSASSAHHSPHLPQDTFESIEQQHSPMQNPQDASLYQEVLSIGNFSLSDSQPQHGHSPRIGLSPAHSPSISPRLGPQQINHMNPPNSFMLMNNGFGGPKIIYDNQGQESFPPMDQEEGQAQPGVPEIKFDLAGPPRQNSFEPPKMANQFDQDALTPPERGRRRRAVSDPYNTPSSIAPGLGANLASHAQEQSARSLSPNDRSGASSPSRRRQSTSSLPNRDYILGLADPEYQQSGENGNQKRVQKHPATFQCNLCPKRFTRAYNLRSHLRTHTDERPFVCTVCGKAFARQHDRKRHEGLHSGEKKFVCKGELKQGGQWGCGRRFARADALGRHFRSEAGRICIKPLLDEEAIERQRQWNEQRMQNMHMQQPQIPVDANGFPIDSSGNYALPAALIAQYPALATMNWSEMPQGEAGLDDDPSGRSSFDASGSEYFDEADDGGYISSGPAPQNLYPQGQMTDVYNGGYSSDIGGR